MPPRAPALLCLPLRTCAPMTLPLRTRALATNTNQYSAKPNQYSSNINQYSSKPNQSSTNPNQSSSIPNQSSAKPTQSSANARMGRAEFTSRMMEIGNGPAPPRRRDATGMKTNFQDAQKQLVDNMYKRQANKVYAAEEVLRRRQAHEYLREIPRKWRPGELYSPHDLSAKEMRRWRLRGQRKMDIIDAIGINPLDLYKNFSVLGQFMSSSGQILNAAKNNLRPVNQRKVAKMIRRAQGMGIFPTIHHHPEVLRPIFFTTQTEPAQDPYSIMGGLDLVADARLSSDAAKRDPAASRAARSTQPPPS